MVGVREMYEPFEKIISYSFSNEKPDEVYRRLKFLVPTLAAITEYVKSINEVV